MLAPSLDHVEPSWATWGRLGPILDALETHIQIDMFWKSTWGGVGELLAHGGAQDARWADLGPQWLPILGPKTAQT